MMPLIMTNKCMVSTADFLKKFREGTNRPDIWNGLLSFILLKNTKPIGVPQKSQNKINFLS